MSAGSCEKSASIWTTTLAPAVEDPVKAGDVGRAQALLLRPVEDLEVVRLAAPGGRRRRPVPSGELSSTTRIRPPGGQVIACRLDHRFEVEGLVVGGHDHPHSLHATMLDRMAKKDPTNAQIADAFSELGTLYELDGADRYRVNAYRDAAKTMRQCPVSIAELTRAGQGHGAARDRQDVRGEDQGVPGHGHDPVRREAQGEVPGDPRRGDPDSRTGRQDRAPPLRRDRRRFDRRPSPGDRRSAHPRDEGPRARRPRRTSPHSSRSSAPRGRPSAFSSPTSCPSPRSSPPTCSNIPACEAVAVAGSARRLAETCKDVDLIATAKDPKALATALVEHPLAAAAGNPGQGGAKITTQNGVSIDLRIVAPEAYGNLLQHFTGSAAHNVELRERAVKMGLSVSEHGIKDTESGKVESFATEEEVYERLGLEYIEPELRESAGRDQGRARRQAAEARHPGRHQGRPSLAHDALGRQERAGGDGRGGALARLLVLRRHRPLRVARLRRPRDARDARGADRGDRRAQRARSRRSASACSRAPR